MTASHNRPTSASPNPPASAPHDRTTSELRSIRSTPRNESTTVHRIGAVSGDQWGVIDHRQLRRLGVSKATVSRWAAGGRLYELLPGVYGVGHPNVPPEGLLTAALFFAGPGATLGNNTAVWWWRLTKREPEVIEIWTPGCRRIAPGIVVHRRRQIDRVWHRRLPVTSAAQTMVDYAATASLKDVRYALAEGEYRDVLTVDEAAAALGRGRAGSALLRRALALHDPRLALTRSELERGFRALCEAGQLPLPEINAIVCGLRVDACWPAQRVVVEVDGYDGHHTPAQLRRDHHRDLILRRGGYTVLRYARPQVMLLAPDVLADLTAALARHALPSPVSS